jgi:DNA-binding transcriptional LysR family regulator
MLFMKGFAMNTRQLYYFVSVAETLNFSQAAKIHYMAQSAISQQIAALEQELDVKLFERTSRNVQLTPAGKVFYEETKVIIDRLESAINKASSAAKGATGSINIGFQGLHEMKFLPGIIKNFRIENDGIMVNMSQNLVSKLENNLINGLADIVFTLPYGLERYKDINILPILRSKWCVVLNHMHPLANRISIKRFELANENYVCIDPMIDSCVINNIIKTCLDSGFTPRIVTYTKSFEETFLIIEAGIGIWFFPKCCNRENNNLRFVELEGEDEYIDIVMLWSKNNHNPAIGLFLKEVERFMNNEEIAESLL